MSMNDRIALELGRALLRTLIAETRVQELEARIQELETQPADSTFIQGEAALT